jgi:hypothetical protein
MPATCLRAILKQLEVLRATFEQKLDPRGEAKADGGIFPDVLGRSAELSRVGRRGSGAAAIPPVVDQKVLSYRDGFVNGGLLEIFGPGQVEEPLLQAREQIETRISFDALLHCSLNITVFMDRESSHARTLFSCVFDRMRAECPRPREECNHVCVAHGACSVSDAEAVSGHLSMALFSAPARINSQADTFSLTSQSLFQHRSGLSGR